MKKLALFSAFLLLTIAVFSFGNTQKTHAMALNPDQTNKIPDDVKKYLEGCDTSTPAQTPGFSIWITQAGDPTNSSVVNVDYGTKSIDLVYHWAGAVCYNWSNVPGSNSRDQNTSDPAQGGVVTGADDQQLALAFNPVGSVGLYQETTFSFQFTSSDAAGFTANKDYLVKLKHRAINSFSDGTFLCIVNAGYYPATSSTDFDKCPQYDATYTVRVRINDFPADGGIYASGCDLGSFKYAHRNNLHYTEPNVSLVGWGEDLDHDWTGVDVYINRVDPSNPAKQFFVGHYEPSQYPLSLNGGAEIGIPGKPPYGTGVPEWHNWFFVPKADTDKYADAFTHTLSVAVLGVDKNNKRTLKEHWMTAEIGACAPPTCALPDIADATEAGTPFTATLGFNYSPANVSGLDPGGNGTAVGGKAIGWSIKTNFHGGATFGAAADKPSAAGLLSARGTIPPVSWPRSDSQTFNGTASGAPKNYPIDWTVTFSIYPQDKAFYASRAGFFGVTDNIANFYCDGNGKGSYNIGYKPYLKVFGNDAAVGGKFADSTATSCNAGDSINASAATDPVARILAWRKYVSLGPGYRGGASSQFAAYALGQINGFASAGSRNGMSSPTPSIGLTFGNYSGTTPLSNPFGGDSGMARCIPDYFSAAAKAGIVPFTGPPGNPYNVFSYTNIPDGTQNVVFVDGDAVVSNDVKYQHGTAANPWTSIDKIPSFYLIVKGNIYIQNDVGHLDGNYIAQPRDDGTGGTIFTCAKVDANMLFPLQDLYNSCQQQLVVTGSFIANNVKFQRAKGTASKSIPDPTASQPQLTFGWTSNPTLPAGYDSANCILVDETVEPDGPPPPKSPNYTWYDNHLCSSVPTGMYWTHANKSPNPALGKHKATDVCVDVNPPTEPAMYTWNDNSVCWPSSANLQMTFVDTDTGGTTAGKQCVKLFEHADPNWQTGWTPSNPGYSPYYLCVPLAAASVYPPVGTTVNELPGSDNIAEVFNFSQENYLTPIPTVLRSVLGGGLGVQKYQSVTSLPPIL